MSMSSPPPIPPGVWAEVYLEEDGGPRHVGRYHFGAVPKPGDEVQFRAPVSPGSGSASQAYTGHIQRVIHAPAADGTSTRYGGSIIVSIDASKGMRSLGQI